MRGLRAILPAAIAALLLACTPTPSPDPGGADRVSPPPAPSSQSPVTLTTDRTSYQPGEAVTLTLTNHGTTQYLEAWLLDPNGTRTASTELPTSLEPGRYQITISLTAEGQAPPADATQAVSPPFAVAR